MCSIPRVLNLLLIEDVPIHSQKFISNYFAAKYIHKLFVTKNVREKVKKVKNRYIDYGIG